MNGSHLESTADGARTAARGAVSRRRARRTGKASPGRSWLLGFGLLALADLAGVAAARAQDPAPETDDAGFQVVVHGDSRVTRLPASTVAKMFLKKVRRWETGESVLPVDLEPRNPIRESFTRAVHNKSITAIKSFWQRMIFSGRGTPPAEKASEAEVLTFVAENPGAVGYVSDSTPLGDAVKQLTIDDLKAAE